jgi:FkbM family methyltransferase
MAPEWRFAVPLAAGRHRLGFYRNDVERMLHALAGSRADVFFIQIGACDGVTDDELRCFVLRHRWRGILVEPLPHLFEELERTYRDARGVTLENVAIAREEGVRDFYFVRPGPEDVFADLHKVLASFRLDVFRNFGHLLPGWEQRLQVQPIRSITFDTLCSSHDLERVDLLQVDTEGCDAEILQSIDFEGWRPTLVVYEHRHLDASDRKACERLLAGQRYEVAALRRDTLALTREALSDRALAAAWSHVSSGSQL